MRRTLLLALLLGTVLGTTGAQAATAPAAGWNATVIAKDGPRHALVVSVQGGAARTIRTHGATASLVPGTRIHTRAVKLGDGTFRASSLTATGRVRRSVVRGVVVKVDRPHARLLLSAGGSVFSVGRKALTGRRSLQAAGTPSVGDEVQVQLQIAGGDVQATGLETLGTVDSVTLDGIVTANVPGKITLAVVHRGLVDVTVPAGMPPLTFAPGDEVVLDVTVDSNGAFTLTDAIDAAAVDPASADIAGSTGGDDEADDDGNDDDSASADDASFDNSSFAGGDQGSSGDGSDDDD